MKNVIKAIRYSQGITQEMLAEKAGIDRVALSQIENDKSNPKATTIVALVKALGVSANVIFPEFDYVCEQQR